MKKYEFHKYVKEILYNDVFEHFRIYRLPDKILDSLYTYANVLKGCYYY